MVTVVNNPGPATEDSGSAGWAVAVIILIVVAGGLFWYFRYRAAPAAPASAPVIQVNVPAAAAPPATQ